MYIAILTHYNGSKIFIVKRLMTESNAETEIYSFKTVGSF